MDRLPATVLALSAAMLCSGCFLALGAGAGVGGYSYIKGELSRTYPAGLDAAWDAAQQALASLSLQVSTKQKDGLGGRIEAQRADKTKVVVRMEPAGEGTTTVRVRVGVFGDKKASEEILGRIARRLKG